MKNFHKRFIWSLWPWYTFGFIALVGTTYITLEIPKLAKDIINYIEQQNFNQTLLMDLAVTIIALGLSQIFIRSLSRILIFWPGRQLEMTLKNHLFAHLMRLPESFFNKFSMGDLISRVANDVGHIRVLYAFGLLQALNLILLLSFAVTKMVQIHVYLTLAVLAPLSLMIVVTKFIMPTMHKYYAQIQAATGSLTDKITEAYVNVHVIQTNAAETTFVERAARKNQDVYDINIKLVLLRIAFWPLLSSAHNLSILVALFYGGYLVINDLITVGDILAMSMYVTLLAFPLTAIGIILGIFPRARTSLERVSVIDEAPQETPSTEKHTSSLDAMICVKNLNFSYKDQDQPTLKDISFTLKEGERLGVYGPVGSGKSTLFNLITRIHTPSDNAIFVKGLDVCAYKPEVLRNIVGYAEQKAQLLSMSIADNLQLGLGRSVTLHEMIEATQEAQIYDEIMQLPDQWDTQIGEKGLRLSGGQKQRLALARFFLRKPEILVLDDVLSAVDHRTETSLMDAIFSTRCTAMIASHRTSALQRCDRVMVFNQQGAVVAYDTYENIQQQQPEVLPSENSSATEEASS